MSQDLSSRGLGCSRTLFQQMQCKAQNGGFGIPYPFCNFNLNTRAPPPPTKNIAPPPMFILAFFGYSRMFVSDEVEAMLLITDSGSPNYFPQVTLRRAELTIFYLYCSMHPFKKDKSFLLQKAFSFFGEFCPSSPKKSLSPSQIWDNSLF